MGLPSVITSDNAKEFIGGIEKQLMEMFGIKHRLIAPYHPQVCNIL